MNRDKIIKKVKIKLSFLQKQKINKRKFKNLTEENAVEFAKILGKEMY